MEAPTVAFRAESVVTSPPAADRGPTDTESAGTFLSAQPANAAAEMMNVVSAQRRAAMF